MNLKQAYEEAVQNHGAIELISFWDNAANKPGAPDYADEYLETHWNVQISGYTVGHISKRTQVLIVMKKEVK